MSIAIVTGASSGIGEEFVKSIAKTGEVEEIWIIARRADRLTLLAEKVPSCKPLPLDLTDESAVDTLADKVRESGKNGKVPRKRRGFWQVGRLFASIKKGLSWNGRFEFKSATGYN